MNKVSIFWFRRDLRFEDNCGLFHALTSAYPILPVFIFDPEIVGDIQAKDDLRIGFIYQELKQINERLKTKGSRLFVFEEAVESTFKKLFNIYEVQEVYSNEDYEPYAIQRDKKVAELCEMNGVSFNSFKDQVIFHKDEILKADGSPYLVYTPYSKKWLAAFQENEILSYSSALKFDNWYKTQWEKLFTLNSLGFKESGIEIPSREISEHTLNVYELERNLPEKDSTSRLSVHLRFGTISIRQLAKKVAQHSIIYLKELIWREFFMMILYHYPNVVTENFNAKYNTLAWRNNESEFDQWCKGETGFILVDAGMKELNKTGFIHNRVRMLVASFLCKHLLIDWRWGEAYFAEKLLDYELSSNNGNWQWASGTGVDAAPYFRIFNPHIQLKKFDPHLRYTKRWLGDVDETNYKQPIVEHKFARERALEYYKAALNSQFHKRN